MKIDVQEVANYIIDNADCDERYEDDVFIIDMLDVRWYVERRKRCFILHVGESTLRFPRC